MSGENVVIISSIDWDFNWQGPQEIATRFAKRGNKVLFIENTGVRTPTLVDRRRVLRRLSNWKGRDRLGVREVAQNIFVHSPIVLPPFGSKIRRVANKRFFLRSIEKVVRKLNMQKSAIWSFLPTDTASDLIELIGDGRSPVVYYIAADFEPLVRDAAKLRVVEREIADRANTVITICSGLSDRYRFLGKKAYTFPYGVDLYAFKENLGADTAIPAVARLVNMGLSQSVNGMIGYVGALHKYVDIDLLEKAARARPGWQWVFVGPKLVDVSRLEKLSNVYFSGPQSHKDLVHFIDLFDVCIVPYLKNRYTDTVVPVKINEYLAMGKPVVSTDIPLVKEFNEYHNVLSVVDPVVSDFVLGIEKCLTEKASEEVVSRRKRIAMEADWARRFDEIQSVIESAA